MDSIELGDTLEDKQSGFKGVAVAKHTYLYGCVRFSLQPKVNDKGELPEPRTFDEPQLKIIKKGKVKADNKTGGPAKYSPQPKIEGDR